MLPPRRARTKVAPIALSANHIVKARVKPTQGATNAHARLATSTNDEDIQRRATAFLSDWIDRNSFRSNLRHLDGSVPGVSSLAPDGGGRRGRTVQSKNSRRASSADPPPVYSRRSCRAPDGGGRRGRTVQFKHGRRASSADPPPASSRKFHLDGSLRGPSLAPDGDERRGRTVRFRHSRRASSADPPPVSTRKVHDLRHLDGSVRGRPSLAPDGGGRCGRAAQFKHGRRASSADPPPVSSREARSAENNTIEGAGSRLSRDDGSANKDHVCLPHLDLGDAGAPRDMTMFRMNSLRVHDFAFVLRSDGRWTYAIVADRRDDAVWFVVDLDGQTKLLSRKHWLTSIRLVNPDSEACAPRRIERADRAGSDRKEEKGGTVRVASAASKEGALDASEGRREGLSTQSLPSSPLSPPRNERNHFGWY